MKREYILPFRERPVVISQGYEGPISHVKKGNCDYRYSLDFVLEPGTEVIAARSGTINRFANCIREAYYGLNPAQAFIGNYVEIRHEDETISHYQHLAGDSIQSLGLKRDQRIEQGQLIGRTGLSGWIGTYPHLHFMVYKFVGKNLQTKAVLFHDYHGPLLSQ